MQEKLLFEYAIIRLVPKVEREEFFNVGVVLYCAKQKFLKAKIHIDGLKLSAFNTELDMIDLEKHLKAFVEICEGKKLESPIANLDAPSRFRWLTATRSTVVQCSKVHPGFCIHADDTLDKIFMQIVL